MAKGPTLCKKAALPLASGLGLLLLGAQSACLPPVPDAPPATIARAVLVCVDSDHDLFAELKPRFTRLEVTNIAESPECTRGKLAAGEVGYTCVTDEASCTTPRFVDGKPIETPTSTYDLVLLFPQLLHGSLSAKTVANTRMVSSGTNVTTGATGSARNGTVATSGHGAATKVYGGKAPGTGSTGVGQKVTDNQLVATPEVDYTGEVLIFAPRSGQLHPGKRFKDMGSEPLRDRLMELLQRAADAKAP